MKKLILFTFLLTTIFSFGQDENVSVVSMEKANVVYWGITNYIKIAVPGAKSFEIEAPGNLKKIDDLGNYEWYLSGVHCCEAKLDITAVMENGEILKEQKTYQLKGLGSAFGTINGIYCSDTSYCKLTLKKDELKEGKIGYKFENYSYDISSLDGHFGSKFNGKVNRFTLFIISKDGTEIETEIKVTGDELDTLAKKEIDKLETGREILIERIEANGFDKGPASIWIELE